MASVESFVIQPFIAGRGGKLKPGQGVPAKTRHHALADGQRLSSSKPAVAVLHILADDETGEVSSLKILARHGKIPEEFEEAIRAA